MTGDDDGPDYDGSDDKMSVWWADRKTAVELLQTMIRMHRNPTDPTAKIALPIEAARVVLECAKAGMHKGQGRGRPRDSHGDKARKNAIASWAKERQRKLHEQGKTNEEAQRQAAEEAREFAHERYGKNLAINTIIRMMQSSDK